MNERRLLVAERVLTPDGSETIASGGVLLEDERILAVGSAADLRASDVPVDEHPGCTILPGLIDSHVHLELSAGPDHELTLQAFEADRAAGRLVVRARENACAALAAGITTLRDCGSTLELLVVRDAIRQRGGVGPRLLAAGPPITTTNGHCHWWGGEADGLEAALAQVRRRAEAGTDIVKIMATGGIMTRGSLPNRLQYDARTLRGVVAEAHRLGLPVVAHALAAAAIAAADEAGVDSIDHAGWAGPDGSPMDDPELVLRLGRAGRAIGLTTSGVVRQELDRGEEGLASLRDRMRDKVALAAAGARVHVHSDAGVRFTAFDRPDLSLRAAAAGTGMSPLATIRAMTSVAAHVLGLRDVVGSLRPGLRADLLIVEGDPTTDLGAVRRVREVWRDGRPVHAAWQPAPHA